MGDNLLWWNDYNNEQTEGYENSLQFGRINNPGLYCSDCFQVNMSNFATNAIANAEELMNVDRDAAMKMQKTKLGQKFENLDDNSKARVAFEYLRKMVKAWIKDVKYCGSAYANELLSNLHKWITVQSNALFQPLLLSIVNELMCKVFDRLMGKLDKLGLNIIYANFSKIFVATGKYTAVDSTSRIQYILRKCVQEEQKLFHYISLKPVENIFNVVVFKDPFNNATMYNESPYTMLEITNLMPKVIGKYLTLLVEHFINDVYKIGDQIREEFAEDPLELHRNY